MLKDSSQEGKGKELGVGEESTTGPGKKEAVGKKLGRAPGPLKQAKERGWLIAIISLILSRKQLSCHSVGQYFLEMGQQRTITYPTPIPQILCQPHTLLFTNIWSYIWFHNI